MTSGSKSTLKKTYQRNERAIQRLYKNTNTLRRISCRIPMPEGTLKLRTRRRAKVNRGINYQLFAAPLPAVLEITASSARRGNVIAIIHKTLQTYQIYLLVKATEVLSLRSALECISQ